MAGSVDRWFWLPQQKQPYLPEPAKPDPAGRGNGYLSKPVPSHTMSGTGTPTAQDNDHQDALGAAA